MEWKPVRRVVTGHDADGKAIIQEDGFAPRQLLLGGEHGPMFHEIWNTRGTPVEIDHDSGEPHEEGIILSPPERGVRIRVLEIRPDDEQRLDEMSPEERKAHFAEIGAEDAVAEEGKSTRHAFMHRTETVDFGIVLEGELVLIMDEGETTIGPGDIVVQRGTNHGWANRSDKVCRIAFILIDGTYTPELKAQLP
ncbi:cupin domain-containing protein [Ponticaulis sp.]|uniref:cupin domain-containing protein n=1 Tax=Ponticaulis sp. TaxID=2020902 RepID=UPI00261F36EE|nr:cupin domain-containing protein [Ponticaulis sp.]MDF1679055.1 cupin domain-containing protein [Ponticaulis sp.]